MQRLLVINHNLSSRSREVCEAHHISLFPLQNQPRCFLFFFLPFLCRLLLLPLLHQELQTPRKKKLIIVIILIISFRTVWRHNSDNCGSAHVIITISIAPTPLPIAVSPPPPPLQFLSKLKASIGGRATIKQSVISCKKNFIFLKTMI